MKTTASSSLMQLDLARSKFHFIRKRFIVEHSTIRTFFCGMPLAAPCALLKTQELPFKRLLSPLGGTSERNPLHWINLSKKMPTSAPVKYRMYRLLGDDRCAHFGQLDQELCRHASSLLRCSAKVLPAFFEVLRSVRSV